MVHQPSFCQSTAKGTPELKVEFGLWCLVAMLELASITVLSPFVLICNFFCP